MEDELKLFRRACAELNLANSLALDAFRLRTVTAEVLSRSATVLDDLASTFERLAAAAGEPERQHRLESTVTLVRTRADAISRRAEELAATRATHRPGGLPS